MYELEFLGVLFGLEKFKVIQNSVVFFLILETDNQTPSWLLAQPTSPGKIGRWVVHIFAFKFRVQHVRNTQNIVADSLFRMFRFNVASGSVTILMLAFQEIVQM